MDPRTHASPRLVAAGLGHRFGRRVLFRELSFTLEGGHSLAVTGSNGSGKSTLLSILAGLRRPVKGEVHLFEQAQAVPSERRPLRTGLVAPYLNVYDGFSARENLRFIARARRLADREARIEALLRQVGLDGRGDEPVAAYSSGMKQRVKVAAALLPEPPLLLLDEPTTNLDAAGKAMIAGVMQQHLARGRLLIVATNDAAEAATCDAQLNVETFL